MFQLQNPSFTSILLGRAISSIMALLPAPRETVDKIIHVPGYRTTSPGDLIDLTIESQIARIVQRSAIGGDEPFFVVDLGQIVRQHRRWTHNMPGIRPFYGTIILQYRDLRLCVLNPTLVSLSRTLIFHLAVKCNSDPMLLQVLAELGTGFDCASIEEMRTVLNLGIDPARILFANPCKAPAAVAFANKAGILRTTFDNIDELDTIKAHMPDAQLLLRIYANDESAFISLGDKFGAPMDTTEQLLSRAWELNLSVVGVSFHVGKHSTFKAVVFWKFDQSSSV